jgi:drug/metabolite transporter (DMT)-like permease
MPLPPPHWNRLWRRPAVAYLWWGEAFGVTGYLGAALILAIVLMMVWDPQHK